MSLVLSIAMSETLAASECPAIKECGVETVGNPYRAMVTAYCEPGKRTATGSSKQEGIVAAKSEWMGSIAAVYKVESDGSIGDFIGYFPIDDTGYGHALVSDQYKSEILKNKKVGTIETGLTLDFRPWVQDTCGLHKHRSFSAYRTMDSGSLRLGLQRR